VASQGADRTGSRSKFYEGLIEALVSFAKYRFFWTGKQQDGASTQEHVDVAKKSAFASLVITEKTFEETPEEVRCPVEAEYLWYWFLELDETRLNSGMGFNAITHTEITHWDEGLGIKLLPFERRAIRAIDKAFKEHANSKANERDKNGRE
jgi:hypothetical protein